MQINARVSNREHHHETTVSTNGVERSLAIPARESGVGSSVNGGELLMLALATCYCNDIYREAAHRQIQVRQVDVSVEAVFGGSGEPAQSISYTATVDADATPEEIAELIRHTDGMAEIHNTLRAGIPVTLRTTA
jgi:uncharacterized OsmC-like protein